jgi:hypothetical protein
MRDRWLRVALGVIGICLSGYGILRLLQSLSGKELLGLGRWLVGALIVHDGLIAPVVIGIGLLLQRFVPDRARAFVQPGLIVGGLISSVAVVLIWRRGKASAPSLTLLNQNYSMHLVLLLALVAAATTTAYLTIGRLRVGRRTIGRRTSRTKSRPAADQSSVTTNPTD